MHTHTTEEFNIAAQFGARLRATMKEQHLSAIQLAETMTVGDSTINSWCRGERFADVEQLYELAEKLSVDPGWLLPGTGMTRPRASAVPMLPRLSDAEVARHAAELAETIGVR